MEEQFEVRDHRNKAMFRMDDEYLNGYSRLCGTNATLVYLCLCRHADRHQESFPSVTTMATKLGVSRDSVIRGIKTLVEWNIISKSRERREDATWLNNRYVLLDKSVWSPKPSSTEQHGSSKSLTATIQVANEGGSQVAVVDSKDTHIKDTHLRKPIYNFESKLFLEPLKGIDMPTTIDKGITREPAESDEDDTAPVYDDAIDEDGIPLKHPPKREGHSKEFKNLSLQLVKYFQGKCVALTGHEPVVDKAFFILNRAKKVHNLTWKDLQQVTDDWLESDRQTGEKINFSWCFANQNLNKWRLENKND